MLHSEVFCCGGLGRMSQQIPGGDEHAAQPGEQVSDGKDVLGLMPGGAGATGGDVVGGLAAPVVIHRCP